MFFLIIAFKVYEVYTLYVLKFYLIEKYPKIFLKSMHIQANRYVKSLEIKMCGDSILEKGLNILRKVLKRANNHFLHQPDAFRISKNYIEFCLKRESKVNHCKESPRHIALWLLSSNYLRTYIKKRKFCNSSTPV